MHTNSEEIENDLRAILEFELMEKIFKYMYMLSIFLKVIIIHKS